MSEVQRKLAIAFLANPLEVFEKYGFLGCPCSLAIHLQKAVLPLRHVEPAIAKSATAAALVEKALD